MAEYTDILSQSIKADRAWRAPHVVGIRSRSALNSIYAECLTAATEARERGTLIELREEYSGISDSILLTARGRTVRFIRDASAMLCVLFTDFPASMDDPPKNGVLELPPSAEMVQGWAKARVGEALSALLRG